MQVQVCTAGFQGAGNESVVPFMVISTPSASTSNRPYLVNMVTYESGRDSTLCLGFFKGLMLAMLYAIFLMYDWLCNKSFHIYG
jgi:hypothetical protein